MVNVLDWFEVTCVSHGQLVHCLLSPGLGLQLIDSGTGPFG